MMTRKKSSSVMSSLAASIMNREPLPDDASIEQAIGEHNVLLADAKRLAGSVLSQDEAKGQADD